MRKKGIDREVVVLLISTLITLASWVGFEIYRAYFKVQVPPDVEKRLNYIDPVLNKNVLVKLEELNP